MHYLLSFWKLCQVDMIPCHTFSAWWLLCWPFFSDISSPSNTYIFNQPKFNFACHLLLILLSQSFSLFLPLSYLFKPLTPHSCDTLCIWKSTFFFLLAILWPHAIKYKYSLYICKIIWQNSRQSLSDPWCSHRQIIEMACKWSSLHILLSYRVLEQSCCLAFSILLHQTQKASTNSLSFLAVLWGS